MSWDPSVRGVKALAYDVRTYGAVGDGATDDTAAIQAAIQAATSTGGGVVFYPPGTYLVSAELTIVSNVCHVGSGNASVIKAAPTLTTALFAVTVAAGGTLHDATWEDLTLDGNSTSTGTIYLISINTGASSNIGYRNVEATRVNFQNAKLGWAHAANNSTAATMLNQTRIRDCYFTDLDCGVLVGGTYATSVEYSFFTKCKTTAVGTPSAFTTPALAGASGPTGILTVDGCHIEGTNTLATGTQTGIQGVVSDGRITNCVIFGVAGFPIQVESNERNGMVIDNVIIWGSGYSGLALYGESLYDTINVTNVVLNKVGQRAGGFSNNHAAVQVPGGSAFLKNVTCADASLNAPGYALSCGASGTVGTVEVDGLNCSNVGTAFLLLTRVPAYLKLSNCEGFNPVGLVTVAVPASATAVAAASYDRTFYITAGTDPVTCAIANGPTIKVPASACVPVFVPAGKTLTPTYTATHPPTWVVEGN